MGLNIQHQLSGSPFFGCRSGTKIARVGWLFLVMVQDSPSRKYVSTGCESSVWLMHSLARKSGILTIPSGNDWHNYGKSHLWWENSLFLWPFSIAMLNYQRVIELNISLADQYDGMALQVMNSCYWNSRTWGCPSREFNINSSGLIFSHFPSVKGHKKWGRSMDIFSQASDLILILILWALSKVSPRPYFLVPQNKTN